MQRVTPAKGGSQGGITAAKVAVRAGGGKLLTIGVQKPVWLFEGRGKLQLLPFQGRERLALSGKEGAKAVRES